MNEIFLFDYEEKAFWQCFKHGNIAYLNNDQYNALSRRGLIRETLDLEYNHFYSDYRLTVHRCILTDKGLMYRTLAKRRKADFFKYLTTTSIAIAGFVMSVISLSVH